MSHDVEIRTGSMADVDALLAFWQVAGENESRPVDRAESVSRLLTWDPDSVIIAQDGDEIVGTIVAGWDGWRAHLYRLAVLPDRRGHGIARRLVAAAEERLTTLGAARIDAMVLTSNALGHHVWRSAGYTSQADWSRWVKPTT